MTMKTLLLTVLFAASMMSAWSQTPAQILEEYRTKAETACQKLNGTLQTQGAAIAAALVAKGDTVGAADISKQIEAKLKGEPVASPHSAAVTLFTQFDTARASAIKPLQAASIQRIEAMLKTSAGKDMKVILELAKAREEIEGSKSQAVAQSVPATVGKMPLEWEYYAHPDMAKIGGRMVFKEDGTFILFGPPGKTSATPGTWATTANSNVLSVQINGGEKGTITMNGRTAVFERPIGTRYLKAK